MEIIRKAIPGLLAAGMLIMILLASGVPPTYADGTWQAKYWHNKTLAGDPVLVRQESEINHDWGDGSPEGVRSDDFSARWKRTLNVSPGSYRFSATMDDGMRIWVDNNLIIDSWYDSQVHSLSATTYLAAGDHAVVVEYYEAGGKAVAKLRIDPVGVTIQNWRGEYFNNMALSGTPALVRDDARIDFDWGGGSPAWNVVNSDQFSVRWTRTIDLEPGRHRWTATTDDGVRLWVNGRLIIDRWFDQAATSYSAETDLPGGLTDVRMEYFENAGGAVAQLRREQLTDSPGGSGGWRGEYYNNMNLSGTPALIRSDNNIDFDWGNGSPASGINKDNFSVRWTRSMVLAPGRHRFTAVTDDGVRLWVNGQQIINDWVERKPAASVGEITLPGGTVDIKMEYYENVGGAKANLTRTQVTSPPTPAPKPPSPTGTVPGIRLNLRSGPAATFAIIRVLAQGETVTLLGRNATSSWVKVAASSNVQGWVYAPLLQMNVALASLPVVSGDATTPPATPGQTATVSSAIYTLNVRSGPGTDFEPVTTVSRGQIVELLGRDSGSTWLKIRTPSGIVGWSSARYLDTSYPLINLPVAG